MGQAWSRAQFKYDCTTQPPKSSALALEFLTEFADSTIPADDASSATSRIPCPGKAAELSDVTNNRETRVINSHMYGTPAATVAFGSIVPIQDCGRLCHHFCRVAVDGQSNKGG